MSDYGNWHYVWGMVVPGTGVASNCEYFSRSRFDDIPDGVHYIGVIEDADNEVDFDPGERDGISSQSYYINFHSLNPQIDSPADNSEVSGMVTVEASSKTNGIKDEDITKMVFQKYEGGSWIDLYTDSTPENGFSYTEDVTNVPDMTERLIRSRAFAMDGSSAVSPAVTLIVRSDIKPDLVVYPSSISFDPSQPLEGGIVTIYAQVFNIGTATAYDTGVRFYLGDPDAGGTQIGSEQTITSIGVGGDGIASVDWNSIGGSHDIYVVVDPQLKIPEDNESNNKASKTIKVDIPQPPIIEMFSPKNTTYSTDSVDLNYSVTNPVSGIDWVGYSLDGQANITVSAEITNFSNSAGVDLGTEENVTFTAPGSNTLIYLRIPKNSTIISANMNVGGHQKLLWVPGSNMGFGLEKVEHSSVFSIGGLWRLITGSVTGIFSRVF